MVAKKKVTESLQNIAQEASTSVTLSAEELMPLPTPEPRAEQCVICEKEYTFRKMGTGNPYEGKPVCTGCLPKALDAEKKAAEAE